MDYNYNLEFLECKNHEGKILNSVIHFVPQNTSHIKLISGNLPINENEVIVSEKLYKLLKNDEITINCGDFSYRVYVSGVVRSGILSTDSIYLSHNLI